MYAGHRHNAVAFHNRKCWHAIQMQYVKAVYVKVVASLAVTHRSRVGPPSGLKVSYARAQLREPFIAAIQVSHVATLAGDVLPVSLLDVVKYFYRMEVAIILAIHPDRIYSQFAQLELEYSFRHMKSQPLN
jgi:hypothetical protein